jgi:hypothetical protein
MGAYERKEFRHPFAPSHQNDFILINKELVAVTGTGGGNGAEAQVQGGKS